VGKLTHGRRRTHRAVVVPAPQNYPAVAEARAFVAEQRGALDAATIAWLDQASSALADDTSMSVLVEAWTQQTNIDDADEGEREERLLARLSTAMAIVAKARHRPLD
jgi:DNA-binding SARP family transcriptional activator